MIYLGSAPAVHVQASGSINQRETANGRDAAQLEATGGCTGRPGQQHFFRVAVPGPKLESSVSS